MPEAEATKFIWYHFNKIFIGKPSAWTLTEYSIYVVIICLVLDTTDCTTVALIRKVLLYDLMIANWKRTLNVIKEMPKLIIKIKTKL